MRPTTLHVFSARCRKCITLRDVGTFVNFGRLYRAGLSTPRCTSNVTCSLHTVTRGSTCGQAGTSCKRITLLNVACTTFCDNTFAAAIIDRLIGTFPLLYLLFALAVLLPNLAVTIRRLHDIDKSGWSILFGLIPLIGGIILLIWYLKRGDNGENNYGPDPLQVAIA